MVTLQWDRRPSGHRLDGSMTYHEKLNSDAYLLLSVGISASFIAWLNDKNINFNVNARLLSVQGLKKTPVGSYKEIEDRMAEGTANRTVAATKMNATSRSLTLNVRVNEFQVKRIAVCFSYKLAQCCGVPPSDSQPKRLELPLSLWF
jgi:hypothetical protein